MAINADVNDYEELPMFPFSQEVPRKFNGCVFPIDPIKKSFLQFILSIKTNDKLIMSHWMIDEDVVKLTILRLFDLIWSSNLVMRTFNKEHKSSFDCSLRNMMSRKDYHLINSSYIYSIYALRSDNSHLVNGLIDKFSGYTIVSSLQNYKIYIRQG